MADAGDLNSPAERRGGSSPPLGTMREEFSIDEDDYYSGIETDDDNKFARRICLRPECQDHGEWMDFRQAMDDMIEHWVAKHKKQ